MYDGWLQFANDEVVNVSRLQAYIKAGLIPDGATVSVCDNDCDTLATGLGHDPYATPILDNAPWFDSSDPDSWEFAGVLPLEITGMSGSTRSAEEVPLARDGSVAGRTRYNGRTIGVTALLVGRTGCAVESGLNWLSTVLAGSSCTPDVGSCAPSDDLCALTCCPTLDEIEDETQPVQPWPLELAPVRWRARNGTWNSQTTVFGPHPPLPPQADRTNLQTAPLGPSSITADGWTSPFDGLPVTPVPDGGAQVTFPSTLVGTVMAGPQLPITDPTKALTVEAEVRLSRAGTRVLQLAWIDAAGDPITTTINTSIPINAGQWGVQRVTGLPVAGAVGVQVWVQTPEAVEVGDTLAIRRVVVEVGTTTRGFFDGDTASTAEWAYAWTGTPEASTSTASWLGADVPYENPRLDGPPQECWRDAPRGTPVAQQTRVVFRLGTVRGPATVSYGAVDADDPSVILFRSASTTISGARSFTMVVDATWEHWRPVVWSDADITVTATFYHRPMLNPQGCFDAATKSYLNVTTMAGPTVVEKIPFACGEYLLKVEWTWLVGNPYIMGNPQPLALGVPSHSHTDPLYTAFGVFADYTDYVTASESTCTPIRDPAAITAAIRDPCCPGFRTPPQPPQLVDDCLVLPNSFWRSEVRVPATFAPQNTRGTFQIVIHNDKQVKRGLRIRIYADPLMIGLVGGLDECNFCEEFMVTFLPGSSVLTIDGTRQTITARVPGNVTVNAASAVRGAFGGPFHFPIVECSTPYTIVVDAPNNYQDSCPADKPPTVANGDQGRITFDLTLVPMAA